MKTERRHELQTNELAIWLTKWVERIQPHFKVIVGVIVLIVTVGFAFFYLNSKDSRGRADAWAAYFNAFSARDVSEFEEVSRSYPGTDVALWALLTAGDTNLMMGSSQLFRDRDAANEELENARDAYQKVVDQADSSADPMIRQRGLYGLAQALESLGEFTKAMEHYQAIVDEKEWSDSAVSEMARHRLEALKLNREWYTWFAAQKPVETPLNTPGIFDNLPNLPDTPDINLPKPGEMLKPGDDATGSATDTSGDVFDFGSDTDTSSDPGGLLDSLDDSDEDSGPSLIDPSEGTDIDTDEPSDPDDSP